MNVQSSKHHKEKGMSPSKEEQNDGEQTLQQKVWHLYKCREKHFWHRILKVEKVSSKSKGKWGHSQTSKRWKNSLTTHL